MPRRTGGDKRSSWVTFQRRLFLVRRLMRGPADAATLIADARAALDAEVYPPDARAALRHDLTALRHEFGCDIRLDKRQGYVLKHLGRLALLDLPDPEMEALAFLMATFADSPLPNSAHIHALLDRIGALLPDGQRHRLQLHRPHPRLEHPRPTRTPADAVLKTLKRVVGRQKVTFAYTSPLVSSNHPVWHCVSPYDLVYRDGHTYLDAYCHTCEREDLAGHYHPYRVDRIVPESVRVLPDCLPPIPLPRPTYELCYVLDSSVASQRDITLWFPDSQVTFTADGSALVRARVTNLWQTRQVLLRYGAGCRVLDPPELIAMMRESITLMAQHYADADTNEDKREVGE